MKEVKHEVITNGTPKFENMTKVELNVFCSELYREISKVKTQTKDKLHNSHSDWRIKIFKPTFFRDPLHKFLSIETLHQNVLGIYQNIYHA